MSETLRTVARRSFFPPRFEQMFQLKADVEMVFDGGLATAGDNNNILNPGMHGFFDAILDQRFVHQRQHFLGLRFRGRKEAGAESGGWENCFTNSRNHCVYCTR